MKEKILKRLKDNLEDMECHPFNEFRDFDERVLFLNVEQIRWLYDHLAKDKAHSMDESAKKIVDWYVKRNFPLADIFPNFDIYIVWKCKVLQNWKYLLSSTLPDGMYYELTYNGDEDEWYLDSYEKKENICLKDGE